MDVTRLRDDVGEFGYPSQLSDIARHFRGDIELKERPQDTNPDDEPSLKAGRIACAGIGFGHHGVGGGGAIIVMILCHVCPR